MSPDAPNTAIVFIWREEEEEELLDWNPVVNFGMKAEDVNDDEVLIEINTRRALRILMVDYFDYYLCRTGV